MKKFSLVCSFLSFVLSCTPVENTTAKPTLSPEAISSSPTADSNIKLQESAGNPQVAQRPKWWEDYPIVGTWQAPKQSQEEITGITAYMAWFNSNSESVPPIALLATGNRDDLEIAFLELERYLEAKEQKIQELELRVTLLEIQLRKLEMK